ncbi:MAG: STAS domain-containing protein [Solirubrobacterales bacterium]|nr:STAS domain-containing protein [Solirubrobacterales bacterium]
MASTAKPLEIHGPIRREDLPGLYARACVQLRGHTGGVLEVRLPGIAPDAVLVDAIARLALAARRHRCRIRLRGASQELLELIEFAGLGELLG